MILYGADKEVCDWVSIGLFGKPGEWNDKSRALGVLKGQSLIAGVVYSDYIEKPDGTPLDIQLSIYSIDKTWATRHNLRALFGVPFTQFRLERIHTLCSANDEGIIMFNKRLGFIQEGVHRQAWPMGGDAISFGMLKNECKWIK